MSKKKYLSKHGNIFNSLVRNAFNFFHQAISELEKKPKYSVINFCSAIELFIKARLMLEHWALIMQRPDQANLDKFMKGDFQSVGMIDALKRLKNITGQSLRDEESGCFNEIREHRNKLVHFYHADYTAPKNKKAVSAIAAEQCKGWYYLHKLLIGGWKIQFSTYSKEINELDHLMRGQRKFLATKFQLLKKTIEQDKQKGIEYFNCKSCGYKSLRQDEVYEPLIKRECLVCNDYEGLLKVDCPNCKKIIYVRDMGEGTCESCGEEIDLEYLVSVFGDDETTKEYATEPTHAFCDICEYPGRPTVVRLGEEWLCLSCLSLHEKVGHCKWCGTLCTGNLEDSGYSGCVVCEGSLESLRESD
jgi:DNA-directed RNA polymerase subunit M/transcription elongation factor TFIIS